MDERSALIILNMMDRIGPVRVRALKARLGSAAAILEADEQTLREADGIGRETARAIIARRDAFDPDKECEKAAALGARLVTLEDAEYPAPLRGIYDPPLVLYVRGTLEQGDSRAVAVVGTRRPTLYGRDTAQRFAGQLARMQLVIVSGLAEGIDTVAHRAALDAGGRTIAVLGGALDRIYPRSNVSLAGDVAEQGAVISEFPLGRQPDRTTFPMRNRIVSGLSRGVLVVEAGRNSGALITARQAAEQGRSVFAVPGRIDSGSAQGCLSLIRDGASMVISVEDIVTELEYLDLKIRPQPAVRTAALSAEESGLAGLLNEGELSVDALIRGSGMSAAEVNGLLLGLEMKRVVRILPGRMVALRQPPGVKR